MNSTVIIRIGRMVGAAEKSGFGYSYDYNE